VDFYEEQVLPEVFSRLDTVFPELGLKRTGKGWTATNREETKARFGARADRVEAWNKTPWGFKVHGGDFVPFLKYHHGGQMPKRADYWEAVKDLARAAGVDCSPLERELTPEESAAFQGRQRRGGLLEDFVDLTHEALLLTDAGKSARAYLVGRTFTEDELKGLSLGFYAGVEAVSAAMKAKGYTDEELDASGILADRRWAGRLVFPFRGPRGRIETVISRDLTGTAEAGAKYLKLKGASQESAVFGLDEALESARREGLLIVEGFLDVVLLQARGFLNVAATGGNFGLLTAERWATLGRLGLPSFTLATDNDPKPDGTWVGREALLKALSNLRNVDNVRNVYVLPPEALGTAKDPDELVRSKGVDAFREALRKARPWAVYMGGNILEGLTPASEDRTKREAVARVLNFSSDLRGEGAALDAEDLLHLTAEKTGYTFETLHELGVSARDRREREQAELEVKTAARELQDDLGKPGANVFELASDFAFRLSVVQGRAEDPPPVFSVDALVSELKNTPEGLLSGWSAVDGLGVRFQPKELAVLGARTGHGKTSALVNLAHAWLDKKLDGPLVFFSHEEPSELVFCRLVALLTAGERGFRTFDPERDWTFTKVRDYLRSPGSRGDSYGWPDAKVLGRAMDHLRAAEARLHIVHRPGWSVGRISAHARELDGTRGVGAVFVDYVQRIPAEQETGRRDTRRDMEVSAIGRGLKALAVDLAVPVVAGAQINREAIPDKYQKTIREKLRKGVEEAVDFMKSARPDLHNLREGGSEQEADLVLGLMNYAADLRTEADSDNATNLYEVGVLKNRYGQTGKWAALAFEGASGLIRDREQGEGLV
jgi:DNA primase/replicative DNA helicase